MPLMDEAEPLLTPAEVSTLFRVDAKTVTRWAKAGKLTPIRTPGGHRRYRESEVRALRGDFRRPDPLDAPVGTLWHPGVSGKAAAARRCLEIAGVGTIAELLRESASDLRDLGLPPRLINEVRLALHARSLALYGEVADTKTKVA